MPKTVHIAVTKNTAGDLNVSVQGFVIEVDAGEAVDFQGSGLVTGIELDPKGLNRPPWGTGKAPKKGPNPSITIKHSRADQSKRDYHYDIIAHLQDGTAVKIDPVMIVRKGSY